MFRGRGVRVMRRRAMVGTAVGVAATASMISNARRNRAERKAIEQQTEAQNSYPANQYPEEQYPDNAQQTAPSQTDELTQQLESLNDLKVRGLITQEEYDAKKKQLLGI